MATSISSNSKSTTPVRIMVWTTTRCLGTAFCRCLSSVPGVQIVYEPFLAALVVGPDRLNGIKSKYDERMRQNRLDLQKFIHTESANLPAAEDTNWFDADDCTYDWVKGQLEAPFDKDTQMVLAKDMAFAITDHYDKIPKGFKHAFLIRNPWKVMSSWKFNMMMLMLKPSEEERPHVNFNDMPQDQVPAKYGYGEMNDLYKYLKEHHQTNPVIIDADDLQNNPASIVRQFLEGFGIPYQDSFLKWEGSFEFMKKWMLCKTFAYDNLKNGEKGWYGAAFHSTCFKPTKEAPSRDSLTEDLVSAIDSVMPVYKELHELRLKPIKIENRRRAPSPEKA